nr:nuclear envelope pore membrane protein POM 121C isoform X2 [Manis javanica]
MSPAAAAAGGGDRRRPAASVRKGQGQGRGWGAPVGAALLGLSVLGLVLYLVPAAAALAWLAVGATAAWWGLSREPRDSRAFSSLVRNARRQRTLLASPPAKAVVNGSVVEPRTLLQGPDPAELLLVGSYLGKPVQRPPSSHTRPPPPAHSAHRDPIHPSVHTPFIRTSRRPSRWDCGTSPHQFVITPRRRYPIQQAQYSRVGVLPTVCWNGGHKKPVPSPRNSRMMCRPLTVRIAPPDSKLTYSPIAAQTTSSTLSSPSSNVPDPCAKETVLNALKQKKKRTVQEEEDQISADGQENKRRRHDSSGSGHSAFEPVVANGVPTAFVPKPGSLKRGLNSQSSDSHLNKRSRTSSVSSSTSTYTCGIPMSSRNAITSSYSSTGGIAQLWKRRGPSASPFSSPASSRSQTPERPAKKIREEELSHHSGSSAPLVTDKESQGEQVADTTTCKKQNSWDSPSTPRSSGLRRRKVQLLPSRRGDPLILPPPPVLGYSITAEDLDLEKKASLQWLKKVFEDKTEIASSTVTENPPATSPASTLTLPAAGTAASSASLPAPSSNPLLESLKKMPNFLGLPSFPEAAGEATTTACSSLKTPGLLGPLGSSHPEPLPGLSSDSRSTATFSGLTPASPTIPAIDATKSPPAPQAETSSKPQSPPAPGPTLQPSVLFGTLSSPPANPSASAAPAVSSAPAMFKPIFAAPPKSGNEGPVPSSPSHVTTVASSSSAPTPTTSSLPLTFSPVFSSTGLPTPVRLSTPFSFTQTTTPATSTSAPLLPAQASVSVPSAVAATASGTTASTATDSVRKPVFAFGVSSVTSTVTSMTSTTASTTQPVLFASPPDSGASFTPAMGSIFQFGKLTATPAPTTAITFGQSVPSAVQTAAGSSTTGFGGTLTTSAPIALSQPAPTFNSTTTPAFNIPFGSGIKPPIPSYPGAILQPTFGAADGQETRAAKPALAPSFGSSFPFGTSAAPAPPAAPAPIPPQPAFGSPVQSGFGGLKPTPSAFGIPSSAQPAFGSTTAVFSFGAATTSGFGATTQTTSSGTSSSVFGSTTSSPFTFGVSAGPAGSGGFGMNVAAPHSSSTAGVFSFGAGQSGTTGTTTPFGGGLSQNSLGAPGQSTPFAIHVGSTPQNKSMFAGTSTPTFGQNTPAPGVGASGSSLSFGASSTPAQGFAGVGTFGSPAPSFNIGAGSKTPGARQRLQARRQHIRKK